MFDPDLMGERLATPALNSRQLRQLEDLGVTREAIQRAGDLGWARVSTIGGRCYTPSPAGDMMIIMAATGSGLRLFTKHSPPQKRRVVRQPRSHARLNCMIERKYHAAQPS